MATTATAQAASTATRRIAVVGGGIAGTFCSLVLKQYAPNIQPVIIDAGRHGIGGRMRSSISSKASNSNSGISSCGGGIQFLRVTDPRLQAVMGMLQASNLVRPWKDEGRFGMLGSQKGGFLPAKVVTAGMTTTGSNSNGSGNSIAGLRPASAMEGTTGTNIDDTTNTNTTMSPTDTGDFCQFVSSSTQGTTYVGVPEMTDICPQIASLTDIPIISGTQVLSATMATSTATEALSDVAMNETKNTNSNPDADAESDGGWILELQNNSIAKNDNGNENTTMEEKRIYTEHFDAVVLATHDPSLASGVVRGIVNAEVQAGGYQSLEDALTMSSTNEQQQQQQQQQQTEKELDEATKQYPLILRRLDALSKHLQQVREDGKRPLFAVQVTYPRGFSNHLPFDAVSIPGSSLIQFLVHEGSKPTKSTTTEATDIWTVITTSHLAAYVMENFDSLEQQQTYIHRVVTGELAQISSPYFEKDSVLGIDTAANTNTDSGNKEKENATKYKDIPDPLHVCSKRWGAAVCGKGLELHEDSILLASWRLAICGDYIRKSDAYPTPWEAAALSGLEAGERMASVLMASTTSTDDDDDA